ncbi:metallophosphoesterase [Fulvivirga kasyanovii]|uniref:Phosphohydrolase n=1 Tax=Fulvivirga kasyanovii TaxID=396812 RepID=A0ABW9RKA2_9BACT|nr:metallophosphoesterase [Fulvivirga kasyanovii]MTI24518.1 phosphohydrolase [Fulvivirga kasyanovii]
MDRNKHKWIAGAGLAAGLVLLDALVLEQYLFTVKQFDIGNKHSRSRPCRMVLLTDLHLGKRLAPKYIRLIRRIKKLNADIILFAGDAIDEDGDTRTLDDFFSRLPATIPKVAILGNHEYKNEAGLDELKALYKKHHIDLLINGSKAYPIGSKRLMVTGLNDFIESTQNFSKAIEGVGKEDMHIALIHSPLQQEKLLAQIKATNQSRPGDQKLNIEYLFAGHNHGGQVTFFGLFPLLLPIKSGDYVNGWYNDNKPYLYVSKGFGNSTVPFRFGARAEMIVFNYY